MQAALKIEWKKLHFVLLPIFFIIHNYFDFKGLLDFSKLKLSMLWWMLAPVVLFLIFKKLFKSTSKASLMSTLLLFVYFFSPALIYAVKEINFISFLGKYSVALPLTAFISSVLFIHLYKTKKEYNRLHNYLTSALVLLLATELILYAPKKNEWFETKTSFKTIDTPQLIPVAVDTSRPDIYFLIFDEHPSTASIKRITGFNNSKLDDTLGKLGFNVSQNATSGFAKTIPALCSLFDLGFYPYNEQTNTSFKEIYGAKKLLSNNRLFPFLQNAGYTIINASTFEFKNINSLETPKEWWGQAEDMIRNQTLFRKLNEDIGWLKALYFPSVFSNPVQASMKADADLVMKAKATVDSCVQLPSNQQKLVFAHFFLPHDPYKYDSTGNLNDWNYKEYLRNIRTSAPFIQQLVYTRNFITNIANTILTKNKRPAIIIIQGDHGLRVYDQKKFSKQEMFNIFSAVFVPDKRVDLFKNDHFAPNTFRILLNNYFQQQLTIQQPWHITLESKISDH